MWRHLRAAAGSPNVEVERSGAGSYARGWIENVRNGELGILPIVVGIVVIGIYIQARNSQFLTAGNFVNLIAQMSPVVVIGMGTVFVLLLGEIDLSMGYVSGMGGVIAAVLLEPGKGQWPTWLAIAAALAPGAAIGLLQGLFVAKLGVPSFVVTLAGLLGWNGVVLQIVGCQGHDRDPGRLRERPGEQLHEQRVCVGGRDGVGGGLARRSGHDRVQAQAGGASEHALGGSSSCAPAWWRSPRAS